MTVPIPVATVTLQANEAALQETLSKRGKTVTAGADAILLRSSKVKFNATVEHALTEQGQLSTLQLDLYNVPDEYIFSLERNGYIKVSAGYEAGGPAEDTIFYGTLDHALPYREGSDRVWRVAATTKPIEFTDVYVPFSTEGKETAVVDILRALFTALGYSLEVRTTHTDIKLVHYATLPGLPVEAHMKTLVNFLASVSGRPHGIIPEPSNPVNFLLLDLLDATSRSSVTIDLDVDTVYNAGPIPVKQNMDEALYATEEAAAVINAPKLEYQASMAFDNRFQLTMEAFIQGSEFRSPGHIASITSISHRISNTRDDANQPSWTTDIRGPFQGGGF